MDTDPDHMLTKLRDLADKQPMTEDDTQAFLAVFSALDSWLSHDGHLPLAWSAERRAGVQ